MSGRFVLAPPPSRRRPFLAFGVLLLALGHGAAAALPPERGERAMVVSPEAAATQAGVDVLRAGGNATDAAISVAFALSVTYPLAAPLGGGGFLLYRAAEAEHHALDFRESAPAALTAEHFLDEEGRPRPGLSLDGGLAVGVPGSVAGLAEAHRRWGSRPWPELLAPAIRLAEEGFEVYPWLAHCLEVGDKTLANDAEARRIFRPAGRPLVAGERLVQTDLARTLRRIAARGADGFYRGPVARAVARTVRRHGGVMRGEDLTRYAPVLRRPVEGRYRGYRIVSFPPPSSGGVALLQMLRMLEPFPVAEHGPGSSLTTHWIAEVERRAFADRSRWLGDPDFHELPIAGLLDAEYLARRGATIDAERATPSLAIEPGRPESGDPGETLHLSVADSSGRAVALTLTLNRWFGTGIVAAGTGVLLNDEIDDFALAPGVPNLFGLVGGEANAVGPGRRPLSSMTPTMVEHAETGRPPALILGSPGGSTIITSVLQVLIHVIDHGMPLDDAVAFPRFHHQWLPDEIRHEAGAFPEDVLRDLERRGHRLQPSPATIGNVNAIASAPDGAWLGVADPRRQGSAQGF